VDEVDDVDDAVPAVLRVVGVVVSTFDDERDTSNPISSPSARRKAAPTAITAISRPRLLLDDGPGGVGAATWSPLGCGWRRVEVGSKGDYMWWIVQCTLAVVLPPGPIAVTVVVALVLPGPPAQLRGIGHWPFRATGAPVS
jgi:hypothetical protein